ncbi:hypothetical protein [Rhodoluna limnophila]|uniref:hypothetical protein n=1 Tax=Rhodoluna limnophila TaxID=232537 RepID=UPI0011066A3A|nr:hypothetical protein [Rhodoluna limnophila]
MTGLSRFLKACPKFTSTKGVGLIEVLLYSALTLIVLTMLAGMLSTMLNVQRNVVNGSSASQQAQLIAKSVDTGIRNATAVRLDSVNTADQFVVARSATAGANISWTCLAWYFESQGDGRVLFHRSSTAIPVPTAEERDQWLVLGEGIIAKNTSGIFSLSGSRLSLFFDSKLAGTPPVSIRKTVSAVAGTWESEPCF